MKYTKELLEQHVPNVTSFNELARLLGISPIGSNTTNLSNRCKRLNVDTSHFPGQSHRKGRAARNRLAADKILVLGSSTDIREHPARLRRAMLEVGIAEVCSCGQRSTWNGKPLQLQIDHINGQYWDNRQQNLRFICPNCHTQTDTWGKRQRTCPGGGMADAAG